MYIFDTNVFYALGHYYPSRFPTIWSRLEDLVKDGSLQSVREVLREIESNCPFETIEEWATAHRSIFQPPSEQEMKFVAKIFQKKQYQGFVKKQNILKGRPVADPFVIAAAKISGGEVVTLESATAGGARIPAACHEFGIKCINLEQFLEHEGLRF
jgi:hypothetical protein